MREPAFDSDQLSHTVKLCDTCTHKVFYDKLDFIYVEIVKFNKSVDELDTTLDKWLYVLKNLSRLDRQPQSLRDKVFDRLFTQAEIATFNPQELREYEDSRKAYRDLKNSLDTAMREGMEKGMKKGLEKGRAEGIEKGRAEGEKAKSIAIAKKMKAMGLDDDTIMQATGLTASDMSALCNE